VDALTEAQRQDYRYYAQTRSGNREAFAEVFAALHGGGGMTHAGMLAAFPQVAGLVKQLLEGMA